MNISTWIPGLYEDLYSDFLSMYNPVYELSSHLCESTDNKYYQCNMFIMLVEIKKLSISITNKHCQ